MVKITWKPKENCPTNVEELRIALSELARNRPGGKLISKEFKNGRMFPGHDGPIEMLAAGLVDLGDPELSTILRSPLAKCAQVEVLNWIRKTPDKRFGFTNGVWTIRGTKILASVYSYKSATVDVGELEKLKEADYARNSDRWLTEIGAKRTGLDCRFDNDGTPVIYQMDF